MLPDTTVHYWTDFYKLDLNVIVSKVSREKCGQRLVKQQEKQIGHLPVWARIATAFGAQAKKCLALKYFSLNISIREGVKKTYLIWLALRIKRVDTPPPPFDQTNAFPKVLQVYIFNQPNASNILGISSSTKVWRPHKDQLVLAAIQMFNKLLHLHHQPNIKYVQLFNWQTVSHNKLK